MKHGHSSTKSSCVYRPRQLTLLRDNRSSTLPYLQEMVWWIHLIPHRGESRGIGGYFSMNSIQAVFQVQNLRVQRPKTPAEIFAFFKDLGNAFIPSYIPILQIRYSVPSTSHEWRWQLGGWVLLELGSRVFTRDCNLEYMSELGAEGTEEEKLTAVLKEERTRNLLDNFIQY